jgi:hypothetical protein
MKPFARGGRSAHGVAGKWWTLTALYPKRLRASVESYSIKQVEALYGFTRSINASRFSCSPSNV